jgi:pseudaminic acid biosynthesis-associated methylase
VRLKETSVFRVDTGPSVGIGNVIGRFNEMSKTTEQMTEWQGVFGKEYTDRNALALDEMENLYRRNYGVTKTDLNGRFLAGMDHSIRILEVGCNVGNQLFSLQRMGFQNLYGIELQSYAIKLCRQRTQNINVVCGSAFDVPFKDGYFDLVFTSGVLVHIHPSDIVKVIKEIHRCTKDYIWGFEYWAPEYTEVIYRGHPNLLWKTDFAGLYLREFSDLVLAKEERLKYQFNDNVDSVFLLRKMKQSGAFLD